MLIDINRLVLSYLIEPDYDFPDWVKELIDGPIEMSKIIRRIGDNPRAIGYIKKIKDKRIIQDLLSNPHRKALKIIQKIYQKSDEYWLVNNKTTDPTMIHWINEQMGRSYLNQIHELSIDSLEQVIEQEFCKAPDDDLYNDYKINILCDIIKNIGHIPSKYNSYILELLEQSKSRNYSADRVRSLCKTNSKYFIELLKSVDIPNYLFGELNLNPLALELLNSHPDNINHLIYANPNPVIMSMIISKLDKNASKFICDSTNNNIYNYILSNLDTDLLYGK